jgi:nucleoside-diphosphate-sugar epimerase
MKQFAPTSRLVLVSSFSVYGLAGLSKCTVLNESIPLEQNIRLRDSYTISEVRQEQLVIQRCSKWGIPWVIVRPGKIYAPESDALPPQLGLRVPGVCFLCIGSKGRIPLTDVSSCARAVYLSGVTNGIEGEILNIIDDEAPTQKEFLHSYEARFGPIPRRLRVPFGVFRWMAWGAEYAHRLTKGNIPPILSRYRADNLWKPFRFDNGLAKKELGWIPNRGLRFQAEAGAFTG